MLLKWLQNASGTSDGMQHMMSLQETKASKSKSYFAEAGVARGVFSPPCVTCGSVESWAPKICCDTTSLGRSFPQPGVVAAALPGVAQVQESCLYELFRACHVSDRMNVHRRSLPC